MSSADRCGPEQRNRYFPSRFTSAAILALSMQQPDSGGVVRVHPRPRHPAVKSAPTSPCSGSRDPQRRSAGPGLESPAAPACSTPPPTLATTADGHVRAMAWGTRRVGFPSSRNTRLVMTVSPHVGSRRDSGDRPGATVNALDHHIACNPRGCAAATPSGRRARGLPTSGRSRGGLAHRAGRSTTRAAAWPSTAASRAVISTSCTSARPTTSWTAWARASQAPRSRRRQRRRPAGRSRAAGGRGERSAGCVGRAPRGRGAVVQRRQCRAAHSVCGSDYRVVRGSTGAT